MANVCENILIISGLDKDLQLFKTQAKSEYLSVDETDKKIATDLSLDKFLPAPKALLEQESKPVTEKTRKSNYEKIRLCKRRRLAQ